MKDIVIDTNVWIHSQNPSELRFESSVELLKSLLESEILLCVDEEYSDEESRNSSAITCEYLKHMTFGSLALTVFSHLAANGRLLELKKRSDLHISRRINQLVSNKMDRIFLNVTYNSEEKCLVSHDFKDFQNKKRKLIARELRIIILEANDVLPF